MKKLCVLFSCLTVAVLMSSCTTDNEETNQSVQNDIIIQPELSTPATGPTIDNGDRDKDIDKTKTKP